MSSIKLILPLSLFFLLSGNNLVCCQESNNQNYSPLQSSGSLPADFQTTFEAVYNEQRDKIQKNEFRVNRLLIDAFYQESIFLTYDLHFSGALLYGTPLNSYLSRVIDILLEDDPLLREKVKVFVVKSSSINAFATGGGSLYINIGLLAKVKTEAELAFILSHEIAHVAKNHNVKGYIRKKKDEVGFVASQADVYSDRVVQSHNYSQKLEFEADSLGYQLYINAGYDPSVYLDAFELLRTTSRPFKNRERINLEFLDSKNFNLSSVKAVEDITSGDDEFVFFSDFQGSVSKTHPKVDERQKSLDSVFIDYESSPNNTRYLYSEESFAKAIKIARHEFVRTLYLDRRYLEAIYECFLLSKMDFSDQQYLERVVAQSLVRLSENDQWTEQNPGSENFAIFQKTMASLSDNERYFLAVSYCLDRVTDYPNMKVLFETALRVYLLKNKDIAVQLEFLEDSLSFDVDLDEGQEVFIQHIQSLAGDSLVRATLESQFRSLESLSLEQQKLSDDSDSFFSKLDILNGQNKNTEGSDILLFDPFALVIDERKKIRLDHLSSDQIERDVVNHFKTSKDSTLFAKVISPNSFKEKDVQEYNEFVTIKEWLRDYIKPGGYNYSLVGNLGIKGIAEKYNCRFLLMPFVVTLRDFHPNPRTLIFWSTLFLPAAPFLIHKIFKGVGQSVFLSVVIDLKEERVVHFSEDLSKKINTEKVLRSGIKDLVKKL